MPSHLSYLVPGLMDPPHSEHTLQHSSGSLKGTPTCKGYGLVPSLCSTRDWVPLWQGLETTHRLPAHKGSHLISTKQELMCA